MSNSAAKDDGLVNSYFLLVGALLSHTILHEGTDIAVADFIESAGPDNPASIILQQISDIQMAEWQESVGAGFRDPEGGDDE